MTAGNLLPATKRICDMQMSPCVWWAPFVLYKEYKKQHSGFPLLLTLSLNAAQNLQIGVGLLNKMLPVISIGGVKPSYSD